VESFVTTLQSLDPALVYLSLFAFALIENLFPPSPSDMAIVFGGALVGIGHVSFAGVLLSATAGSALGFLIMYMIGKWFGRHILEQKKLRFLPLDAVRRVEEWFRKYGYWVVVGNRFLTGTRAVVSFFVGMSELDPVKTVVLSFVSALVWNAILVSAGYGLGSNWERIGFYISTYSQVVTGLILLAVMVFGVRAYMKTRPK
jgi:membrane protein DedA with SNARE-associated domain